MGVSVVLLCFQHYSHNPLSAIKYLCDIISFLALPFLELPSVLHALGSYFDITRVSDGECMLYRLNFLGDSNQEHHLNSCDIKNNCPEHVIHLVTQGREEQGMNNVTEYFIAERGLWL